LERINELIELSGMVECLVELSLEKLVKKTAKDTPWIHVHWAFAPRTFPANTAVLPTVVDHSLTFNLIPLW
jgi:hypothetical protein